MTAGDEDSVNEDEEEEEEEAGSWFDGPCG